ncbi:MAG: serine/threonine-protein kinase, partial [Planctomycetota bacterium]
MPDDAHGSPSFDVTAALKPRPPSLEEGREIGRSRVVGYLGRGGMGEVYEVEHVRLGKRYALKVILPEHAREEGFVERFEREARVTARLEHPNIVRVDDFGEEGGLYWLRMELAGGVDVSALLGPGHEGAASSLAELARAGGGRLPEPVVAELAAGMLEGVAHAHAGGVVHRDLKPANVLLTEGHGGRSAPKVSDFGLARVVGEDMVRSLAALSARMDLSGAVTRADATTSAVSLVGTYEYMSPEQRRGEPVGPASDVYAAGLVVYRLLTGRHSPGFKRPSEVEAGLDRFWDGFLEKALDEDPAARFAGAGAMLAALRARRGAAPAATPAASASTAADPAA